MISVYPWVGSSSSLAEVSIKTHASDYLDPHMATIYHKSMEMIITFLIHHFSSYHPYDNVPLMMQFVRKRRMHTPPL